MLLGVTEIIPPTSLCCQFSPFLCFVLLNFECTDHVLLFWLFPGKFIVSLSLVVSVWCKLIMTSILLLYIVFPLCWCCLFLVCVLTNYGNDLIGCAFFGFSFLLLCSPLVAGTSAVCSLVFRIYVIQMDKYTVPCCLCLLTVVVLWVLPFLTMICM